jgi:MinD-like ATPase involved in chromosome partitioning or flagellar assembly
VGANSQAVPVPEALAVVLVGIGQDIAPHVRRELLNNRLDIVAEFPSAAVATEALREHRKHRRVVVTQFRSASDEAGLRRLNVALVGWPVIALVDVESDPENLFRANRAGAAQVVPLPLQPADFRCALDAVGVQFDLRSRVTDPIVFSGGSAGCGASTLACAVAHEFAVLTGTKTVLIELVPQMGTLATNLKVTPKATLDALLTDADRLDMYLVQNALTPIGDNLLVLPGPTGFMAPGWIRPDAVDQLIDLVRRLAGVVILDVHPTFDDLHFRLIDTADRAVLVMQQSIAAVRSLKLLLDNLSVTRPADRTHFVLNMYDPDIPGLTLDDIEQAMEVPGIIPVPRDTAALLVAMKRGGPLRLVAPHSPILKAVAGLVHALGGPGGPPRSGFFTRLVQAFGG